MKDLVFTAHGHAVVTEDRDAQVPVGFTFDGTFYRTAVMCRTGITESIDIISPTGEHLARININTSDYPSVEVFTDLESSVEVNEQGKILSRTEIIYPEKTTTIIVIER